MHSQQKHDPIKTSHDREGMLKKTRDLSLLWQVIHGSLHIVSLTLFTPPPSIAWENPPSFRDAIKRSAKWCLRNHFRKSPCQWRVSSASDRWSKLSFNQKHYPDKGSDTSSVWNFCALSSGVISRGNRLWLQDSCFLSLLTHPPPQP